MGKADLQLVANKVPPQATDIEEAVLGACMLERDAFTLASEILTEECFYVEKNRKIFAAMKELSAGSMAIDLLTVVEVLRRRGDLEAVGGAYYVTYLTNTVASTANLETHCRIVVQKHMQREMIRIGGLIATEAYKEMTDPFDLFELAERSIFEVTTAHLKRDFRHISLGIKDALEKVEMLKNREYTLTGVPTGFSELDIFTNGWQPTDLIIIAARPSQGKTAFALNLACNAVFSTDKPVPTVIFSMEMSEGQIINRILSSETKIPLEWIQNGRLSDGKLMQLSHEASERIALAPLYIDDTPGISVFELRAKARRLVSKHNVGLIIIDYLQLMSGDGRSGNREQEISKISRDLKGMAKDLNVPVIALSQLSREIEKRKGKPMLSDLRESGAIEQDADMVSFIYRPDEEDQQRDPGQRNRGTLKIGKHRNGQLGEIVFYVDLSIQKWFDLEDGVEYEKKLHGKIPVKIANQFYRDPTPPENDFSDELPF